MVTSRWDLESLTSAATRDDTPGAERQDQELAKIIEADIIPRLLLTHRVGTKPKRGAKTRAPVEAADFDSFFDALIQQPFERSHELLLKMRRGGVSTQRLLVEVLAPCARRLGEMWETDQLDFLKVTIATSNLHKHFHKLCPPVGSRSGPGNPKLLLSPAPGEQHIFGLLIVGEMFRRSGWVVTTRLDPHAVDLLNVIGQEEFDAVGITVNCDGALPKVAQLVDDLRLHSTNPGLIVLAGGSLFSGRQHLARAIGADYVTANAAEAVDFASRLLEHKCL